MKEWEQFLQTLEQTLGKKPVDEWLRPLKIIRFDAANLYLEAPSPLHVSWFEEYVRPKVTEHLKSPSHRPIKLHWAKALPTNAQEAPLFNPFKSNPLDPFLTFPNFIESPKNQVAYSLFQSWLSSGKLPFNPLFLFGPPHSGKTHLLMAAANHFSLQKKVLYINANTFTEHLVTGIRSACMDQFRKSYREVDLLIVDQIDQMGGRASTQEEFFHTFNTLHMQGKQILLASRFPPSKLQEIEPRLISRFEWGLPLEIGRADPQALVTQKASLWKLQLDPALISFIVHQFAEDPITPLQALALRAPKGVKLTKEGGLRLLHDLIQQSTQKSVTFEDILEQVANHFSIAASEITGKSQKREHALPRQIAMYLCREKLKLPYQAIGKLFGRDHSTVMGNIKQIEEKIAQNSTFLSDLLEKK